MKTSLKRFTGCIFILGVLFLSAIPASHARELYVAYSVPGDIFHLGRIDHADPEVVEDLGTMGHKLFRALEFAGDGRLYAYENQLWGPSQLYEVNPSNAALTPVGPSGSQRIDGMAYNPVDGRMYGVDAVTSKLFCIDLETGNITTEGTMREDGPLPWSWIAGIAADDSGYFYIYNNAGGIYETEQGVYRSTEPGGLDFEWIYDLNGEFGLAGSNLQTPAPLYYDWSSPDGRGYGWVQERDLFLTGWYGYDWGNDPGLSWTRYPPYPLEYTMFYAWTAAPDVSPLADIKVNGSDEPVTIVEGQDLTVEVSLDPRSKAGEDADWWLLAESPFGWYRYDLGGGNWVPGLEAAHMGPLTPLEPSTAYDGTASPAGFYTLYFGVDTNMNGTPDMGAMHYDSVEVTVLPR